MSIWQMYSSLYAATTGSFDKVPVEKIKLAERHLFDELEAKHKDLTKKLNSGDKPTEDMQKEIVKVATDVAKSYEVIETSTKKEA